MTTLQQSLFVVLFVSCVVGLLLHQLLLSRLRSRHPRTWETLGQPTLFLNNRIANGLATLRFLWRRDYQTLDDEKLTRLANFLRHYQVAYLTLFVVTLIAFFTGGKN